MAPAAGVVDVEVVPKFAGRLFKARSPWAFNPGCSLMLSPSDWPPHTYTTKPTKLHPYGHNLLVRELSFMQALVQGAHKRQALKDSCARNPVNYGFQPKWKACCDVTLSAYNSVFT